MLTCNECKKVFGTKGPLSNHMVLHRGAAVLAGTKNLGKQGMLRLQKAKFPLKGEGEDPVDLLL